MRMGMADDARRVVEQNRRSSQQSDSAAAQVESTVRQIINTCAREFAASAHEMKIKPMKRFAGGMLAPKYFMIPIVLDYVVGEGHSKWVIFVNGDGSWRYSPESLAGSDRPVFPPSLPADAETKIRAEFTNALALRAEGYPERHSRRGNS